jgi:glyoxylase-like metal-dependent hydrolase (beta-lactamase superfamily II)
MADLRSPRPGLWLVESAVEDFDVRAVVVAGRERAVVWDTLARPADMAGVAQLVGELPITVVYSHGDWDHVWGTAGLARPPREIVAHQDCLPRFAAELPAALEEKRAAAPGEFDEVVLLPPTRAVGGRERLDLGGLTLELLPLPGHTPDSLVGFIPGWGVLLAGDTVETPLPFLNPGSPVEEWAGALESWAARLEGWEPPLEGERPPPESGGAPLAAGGPGRVARVEDGRRNRTAQVVARHPPLVLPSHGPIGGPELLRRNAAYLQALRAGAEPELPASLAPFYVQTHAANLRTIGR